MVEFALALIPFLLLVILILCTAKGVLRWAGFSTLLIHSLDPLVVAFVSFLTPATLSAGQGMARSSHLGSGALPLGVALFMIVMAFVSLKPGEDGSGSSAHRPSPSRWVLLVTACLMALAGPTLFFIAVSLPQILRLQKPEPSAGVIAFLTGLLTALVVFYHTSKKNSQRHPNLMRWIILYIVGLSAMNWLWLLAMVLLYGVPGDPRKPFPFHASLIVLAYIPLSLLVFGMVKDSVRAPGKSLAP